MGHDVQTVEVQILHMHRFQAGTRSRIYLL